MRLRRFIVVIVISLLMPAVAAAQNVPNPVQILYGFKAPNQTYKVHCWSDPGIRGTWLRITDSTFTTQDALIYAPQPPTSAEHTSAEPSILYCFAADGKPGIISGAPPGVLLPPGSRVEVYRTAQIMLTHLVDGRKYGVGVSVFLDDHTRIVSGATGIVVRSNQHEIKVYPVGATLTIGGGEGVGYFRPGAALTQLQSMRNVNGCAVSYINDRGEVARTVHYAQNCPYVQLQPLTKR